MKLKVKELTHKNKEGYLDQVAELEIKVLNDLEQKGKEGQLFITGREDIEQYIDSDNNSVIVSINENNQVQSATYITQGQLPFTYNDITKYFKSGNDYKQYIKSKYNDINQYHRDILEASAIKLKAYRYAKSKVLEENPNYTDILEFMNDEKNKEENHFHEKSILRESLNSYMSEYIEGRDENEQELYESFYYMTIEDISEEFNKEIDVNNIKNKEIYEYEQILQNSKPVIHSSENIEIGKYYTANTKNAIEIDTYITDPENRQNGLARILVFEGIKKHMQKTFENGSEEVFLCSTLHRDNLSSKYVSEFFGLTDSIYVNRRFGRDREVHITRIMEHEYGEYIDDMENKLAVLYGYNPQNKDISSNTQLEILEEQLQYEQNEIARISSIADNDKSYKGKISVQGKYSKIESLKSKIESINNRMKEKDTEDIGER